MTTQQKLIQYINNQKKFIKSLVEFYGYPIFIGKDKLINQKLYEKIPLINDLIKQNETHHYVPMDIIIIKTLIHMNTIWTQTYNQYKRAQEHINAKKYE